MKIGELDGLKIVISPEHFEEIKRQKLIEENEILSDLQDRIDKAIEYINKNWGHWCSNHCKYATETINILQGSDKE